MQATKDKFLPVFAKNTLNLGSVISFRTEGYAASDNHLVNPRDSTKRWFVIFVQFVRRRAIFISAGVN